MQARYWSCSNFADKLRGTQKPESATGDEWVEWKKSAKRKHPFRFWLAEELLDRVQSTLLWPFDQIYNTKYYVVNRWIDQSHALVAHPKHIKPGEYMDLTDRILYCLFDELVDHVEIDLAYNNVRWDGKKVKSMRWWQAGKWRTRTYRNAEAGLDYLNQVLSLSESESAEQSQQTVPASQADAARETLELYKWWTVHRPLRPDPYEISGWNDYCNSKRNRGIDFLASDPDEHQYNTGEMLDKIRELKLAHTNEDEEMLIRLIKIRGHLWI